MNDRTLPLIIAHRGFSAAAPENTLAAFARAIAAGADGIELDVHMSRDGRLVVCHDPTLERTTDGQGLIAAHTWEELRRLDAGSWYSPAFAGERLPALEEVAALACRGSWRGVLNIELANLVALYRGIEAAVVRVLREYDLVGRALISSFNHPSLVEVRRLDGQVATACLVAARLLDAPRYVQKLGCRAVHAHALSLTPEYVASFHAAGIAVHAWGADGPALLRRAQAAGADAVIVDDPVKARLVLTADGTFTGRGEAR